MKKIFCVLILLLFFLPGKAQFRGNNWIFGDSILMQISGINTPAFGLLSSDIGEEYSSISDSLGNLIFYSGGRCNTSFFSSFIYDRTGNYMDNSVGTLGYCSATQGTIILPYPDNLNLFYSFSISIILNTQTRLYYNLIDMSLNNGLGKVVQKNVLVCDSSICEIMNAVKHANGRDWWLIVHERLTSNYFEYLITPDGFNGPFTQSIGLGVTGVLGECVFSEKGDKFAHAMNDGNLQLMDFDRCTGVLSNCIELGDSIFGPPDLGYYGCSFSPGGTKLYASYWSDSLFQFDLPSTDIKASRTVVYGSSNPDYGIGQHQLAENGKIYITNYNFNDWNIMDSISTTISVINDPDSIGATCNFAPMSISTNGRLVSAGLPNNPNYGLGPVTGSICDSLSTQVALHQEEEFSLYPNPCSKIVYIKYNHPEHASITVRDMQGYTVLRKQPLLNTLDISALKPGIYILTFESEAGSISKKLLKMNADQ
jgi:hypothetical protein